MLDVARLISARIEAGVKRAGISVAEGVRLVDAAVTAHVAAEQEMLAPLSDRERQQLDRLTAELAAGLRGTATKAARTP